ncbi:Uncharacterised protein [Mycobacterium tuberculosis]|uniref:Uncharacterized protein n=1 Tax=Mycobacterium tuberculosis TaxID=1773 RepID=A0A655AX54_MYCTX|nr:Uncharacterised protein [Mycobacterium tuberculosis]CKU94056.1 Uncharacterised protein [Mycobacterium tuberculosis]CKV18530.1 Uncharacterised protein [Mycobacterium tuberculosis]CKV45115.1 Uncharacterised protein [Mycobacterium tuberculosis]
MKDLFLMFQINTKTKLKKKANRYLINIFSKKS